jgi:hypothetical protein
VEAGYNTSTVALREVEGDEKGTGAWGYNWGTLSLGHINTGTWSLDLLCDKKKYFCKIEKSENRIVQFMIE